MRQIGMHINNDIDRNLAKLRLIYSCIDEVDSGIYIAVDYTDNRLTYYNSNTNKILNFSIDTPYIITGVIIKIKYQNIINLLSITTDKIIELCNDDYNILNIHNNEDKTIFILMWPYNLSLDSIIIDSTTGKQLLKKILHNFKICNNINGPFWNRNDILATFRIVNNCDGKPKLELYSLSEAHGVEKLDTFIRRNFGIPEYLSNGTILVHTKNRENHSDILLDSFGQLLYTVDRR